MFEGTLVESRGMAGTGTERWSALGSVTFQCALVGLLIAIPMLRPEVLPTFMEAPKVALPLPYRPPVIPVRVSAATAASTAPSLPAASPAPVTAGRPLILTVGNPSSDPAPSIDTNMRMGGPRTDTGLSSVLGIGNSPSIVVAHAHESGPARVSSGVSEGMLLTPIQPVYPPMAKMAGVHGAVVMEATISKEGRIEGLHVVSGPAMLRNAAMAAVQTARYRPYLLSGDPTEVQTTVTVIFNLGS